MHKYIVKDSNLLTPTTLLLTLEKVDTNKVFDYEAGQYAAISFNINEHQSPARCFSLTSAPNQPNILQFSIRLSGRYTKTLATIKPGDAVNVRGPYGSFVINANRDRNIVMIAGGIGIAPFIGMIRQANDYKYYDKISLIYSSKNQDDIPFWDEIIKTEKSNKSFSKTIVISEGPIDKLKGHDVKNGRITSAIIDEVTSSEYKDKIFFICGPPNFMKSMVSILRSKNIPNSKIITEAFGQGLNRQTGKLVSWPNNIYALGAAGIAMASVAVMVNDIVENLPKSFSTPSSLVDSNFLTNNRQDELDKLVNSMPVQANEAPVSSAASSIESTTSTTSGTTTPAVTNPAPVVKPAPVVVAPKCTTSQSGTTTCI